MLSVSYIGTYIKNVVASFIGWASVTYKSSSTGSGGDGSYFGRAVEITPDGNYVYAYCGWDSAGAETTSGAVYRFVVSGDSLVNRHRILGPDPSKGAYFGRTGCSSASWHVVAITATVIPSLPVSGSGGIYVYNDYGETLVQILQSSLAVTDDAKSPYARMSSDGKRLIFGYHKATRSSTTLAGAISVWTESDGVWTESQILDSPAPQDTGYFGGYTYISGNGEFIMGSELDSVTRDGSVHVYRWDGTSYNFHSTISNPEPVDGGLFRVPRITEDGMRCVIGCSANEGKVFAFEFNGTSWVYTQTIKHHLFSEEGTSTSSLALSADGSVLAIRDTGSTPNGRLLTHIWDGSTWIDSNEVVETSDATTSFGFSFGMSRADTNMLIVGDMGVDSNSGKVHVYLP